MVSYTTSDVASTHEADSRKKTVKYKNTDVCQKQERELDEIISIPYYSLNANCGMPNAKCGIPLQ